MNPDLQNKIDKAAHKYAVKMFDGKEPSIGTTNGMELTNRDIFEADRENFKAGAKFVQGILQDEIDQKSACIACVVSVLMLVWRELNEDLK